MKLKPFVIALSIVLGVAGVALGQSSFTPGHIFVSMQAGEGCDIKGGEAIVEVDPTTGTPTLFADGDDGMCLNNGLRFTPDNSRLLVLNYGHFFSEPDGGWVQSFGPDGSSTIILDESDGLSRPNGANGLAFNASGDLFVVNSVGSSILRFPADGSPATVFADSDDGILGRGALHFAPNGDLFYCGDGADAIIRIEPNGDSSVFDTLPAPSSLAIDSAGNLFVGAGQAGVGATIYRYDDLDPASQRVLAQGFDGESGVPLALTLSADEKHVYFVEIPGILYAIDAEDGTTSVLSLVGQVWPGRPGGIAVFAPEPVPAIGEWGVTMILVLIIVSGTFMIRGRGRL